MTFEQLDCFIAAVECDTFFDAADKLHTTQSTLSKQILKLEKELEISLFDRSKRSAVITPAGKTFYKEALLLSHQYHEMLSKMRSFTSITSDQLRIGTLPILSQYDLMPLLNKFQDDYPKIQLSVTETDDKELLDGFSHGKYDPILAREGMIDKEQSHFLPVAKDRLSVMLPDSHPFAGRSSLSIRELSGESFILMHPYTSIYQLCMSLFTAAGITPHILRTGRMESIISAVSLKEGISLFAESNFRLFRHDQVTSVPLKEAPKLLIGIAYKKAEADASAIQTFCDYCSSTRGV